MTPKPQEFSTSKPQEPDASGERVVISGIAGLYPSCYDVKELSEVLYNKVNPIKKTNRWQYNHPEVAQFNGNVPDLSYFDAQFFKVHYRLCNSMDAMARKILEQSYQAIYDAGVSPEHLSGKKVGVYIGTCFSETEKACFYVASSRTGFGIAGCNKSMFANRISYWLNAKGPSMSVDEACCSSTAALELAYNAIARGDCEAAIVGGGNLCLHPQSSVHYGRIMKLSMDGKTRSFDMDAAGCAKSEAINVLFLQKAKDALRIYADVVHVKSEFSSLIETETGPKYGFYRDPKDTTRFLNNFYEEAKISPQAVEYVEAFGSAVPEADKSELEAIDAVFCKDRKKPLLVGSVMSNIGYGEAASGITAITKVVLGYYYGKLAGNLNCETPRKDVSAIRDGRIQIVTEHTKIDRTYAAVNCLSITGINGHVLLHGHYKPKDLNRYKASIPRIVLLSGRQESSVRKIINDLKSRPIDPEEHALLHNIHETRISGHLGRGFVILDTNENNETVSLCEVSDYCDQGKRPLWFVYSGMGSQWVGMGKALMRIPIFAAAIEKCHRVLHPRGVNIIDIITSDDKNIFDNILHSFVGITAIQIGLTDVLRAMDIHPDNIIGHSLGEIGCSYADGCFTAEETILCSYSRGLVSIETPFIHGSMAAVGIGYKEIVNLLPPEIEVACHNSSQSCTISGPAEIMSVFVKSLTDKKIFAKEVPCSNIAYHSRYIADAGPALYDYMSELIKNPKLRSPRWLSTSVPQEKWNEPAAKYCSAEYHTNNLLNSVLFEETSQLIPPDAVLIEIAPHSLLQAILKRSLPESCRLLPLTRRGHPDNVQMVLEMVGKLSMEGFLPKVKALYPKIEFPVSTSTPMLSHLVEWAHQEKWTLALYAAANRRTAAGSKYIISTHDDENSYLKGHVIGGKNRYPFAAALVAVWDTFAMSLDLKLKSLSVQFSDIHFYSQPVLHDQRQLRINVTLHRGSGRFEVMNQNSMVIQGIISSDNIISRDTVPTLNSKMSVKAKDVYQLLYARDYQYNYDFQSIHGINEALTEAQIEWKENWVTFLDGIFQLNILKRNHDTVSKLNFIRKLVIDVEKHSKIEPVKKNELLLMNANVLEVYDTTICGGVVLESVKFVDLPVVNDTNVVLSKLTRAPFFPTQVSSEKSALSLFLQIVADNVMKREINVFEIPNKYKDYSEFNNIIEDVINIIPNIKANYLKRDIVNILDNNHREFLSTVDLILVSNLMDDIELIQALYGALPQNTFFVNKQTEHLSSRQRSELYFVVSELNVGDAILYLAIWRPTSPDPLRSLVIRSSQDLPETKTLGGEYYLPLGNVVSSENEGMLTATSPGDLNSLVWVKATQNEIESDVDIKVCYVGVNSAFTKKFSEPNYLNKESVQTNNVSDFSGITNSGTRVMGVVQSDTISSRLRSHSDLLWPVPDHWSLEEAATVPLAYSMAFYMLFVKPCLVVGAPILIHGGAGALGQALISIALAHGCEVFTTVSNNAKKQFLRKLFPKVKNEHIGNSRDVTFCDMVLNETKGKGCQTVVACTKGYLKNVCSKCCACTGFLIDVAQIQNREDFKFGLHSLTFERQYVTIDFTSVFKPEFAEDLKTLRTMMIKGIQDGYVRPLSRVIFGAHDVSRAFHMQATRLNRGRVLLDLQHLNLNILPRLTCSPSSWQVLLSDDEMLALKIAERLLKQGAKKIVLLLKDPSKSVIIQSRFWSKDCVEVKIINDNIWKESSWLTCIQQCKGSPVETVFLITSDEEAGNIDGIVENLCTIVQKSCPFLKYFTLVSAGAFQNKTVPKFVPLQDKTINVTLPTVNTMYKEEYIRDNTLSINNAVDVLESAVVQAAHSNEKNILVHFPATAKKSMLQQLMNIAGINEETFLRSENQDKTLREMDVDQTRLSALQRYMSDVYDITWKVEDIEVLTIKMISELQKEIVRSDFEESNGLGSYFSSAVADELLSTTEMIFLPTLTTCSSMRDDEFDATETYLCIVPGVEGQHSRFRDMCERLKLPALVLQPGLTNPQESVAELASRYAQTVLKKTELKDKFYLLGYESGVLVALEMAAILEQNGLTGTVFCIGGSPTEILANFKQHLSEYKTKEELQVAVLKHMYTMMTNESTAPLDNIVTKNLSWSEKVNACLHTLLGKIPHPIQFAKELIEAAYARLAVMLQHTPKPKLLRSQVISVRPRYLTSVDSSLQDYASKKVISYQLEAPLSCAPQDLMCAAIINRHLDDDILENFNSRSHCETYLLNANTFMTTEHDIE
ncbi:fatty acid synthase-like [Aricia agestis]|uniref:fatty acid synthase-like n=1 Tax=Aricia agestis TaxID=91739 RepID=UPI001C205021|nr:fatty acid synthase-like [Aricia agestis]